MESYTLFPEQMAKLMSSLGSDCSVRQRGAVELVRGSPAVDAISLMHNGRVVASGGYAGVSGSGPTSSRAVVLTIDETSPEGQALSRALSRMGIREDGTTLETSILSHNQYDGFRSTARGFTMPELPQRRPTEGSDRAEFPITTRDGVRVGTVVAVYNEFGNLDYARVTSRSPELTSLLPQERRGMDISRFGETRNQMTGRR